MKLNGPLVSHLAVKTLSPCFSGQGMHPWGHVGVCQEYMRPWDKYGTLGGG